MADMLRNGLAKAQAVWIDDARRDPDELIRQSSVTS
jgi:hypothetical protein